MRTATATMSPSPISGCVGDCDENGVVTIDELAKGVDLASSGAAADACPAGDRDGDDRIGIDELIASVNEALGGCP
jgi:hypothetical protein